MRREINLNQINYMPLIKSLFWNTYKHRIRALWRIAIFLLMVAILVNPVILLLDNFYGQLLNQTTINIIVALGFGAALYLFIRFIDKDSSGHYGLYLRRSSVVKFFIGAGIGAILVVIIVGILWLCGLISPGPVFYIAKSTTISFCILAAGQCLRYISGSFFEELFSRSFLIRHISEGIRGKFLSDKKAIMISCIFTAIIFGIIHGFNPHSGFISSLNLSLLGMIFGLSYIYSGDLAWPIGLHFGWNVFQNTVFGMPNSGKDSEVSFLTIQLHGDNLWTGGSFGIEASVITTLIIVVAILVLLILQLKMDSIKDLKIYLFRNM